MQQSYTSRGHNQDSDKSYQGASAEVLIGNQTSDRGNNQGHGQEASQKIAGSGGRSGIEGS